MRFNAGTVSSPASRQITIGPTPRIVSLTASPVYRADGLTVVDEVVEGDAHLRRSVSGVSVTDFIVSAQTFGSSAGTQWTSSNPSVGTVDQAGRVTHVSNGTTTITATLRDSSVSLPIALSSSSGRTIKTLLGYVSGSLAHHISSAIDSRLTGKDPAIAKAQFSTKNHTTQTYTKNPNNWAADVDLTAQSVWNSVGGQQRAGTLISPCHLLVAAHFPLVIGTTVRFLASDGSVVNRTVISAAVRLRVNFYPDFQICRLNADVPGTVSFARVLPSNWRSYLPSVSQSTDRYADGESSPNFRSVPAIYINRNKSVGVLDWFVEGPYLWPPPPPDGSHGMVNLIYAGYFDSEIPTKAQRNLFQEPAVHGDSGSAGTLLINGHQVLLSVATYGGDTPRGGGWGGTSMCFEKELVNEFMTTLGGGYQLTEIDLSSFPTY
jgi:hypothetical protein